MTLPGRHVGAFAMAAALALTPALRVACLVWCAGPATTAADAGPAAHDARLPGPQAETEAGAEAAHAHHAHHHATAEARTDASPTASSESAGTTVRPPATPLGPVAMTAAATSRCDRDRGRPCTDAATLAPLPGGRTGAADAMPALLPPSPSDPRPHVRVAFAPSAARVPPPGPPPAALPLRI